ncbi:outer membrane assembly protein BamC [Actinobacillus seminis]|uniref:Outer membrane protein assembly factor BamC n=1 Tax=Actinobacillus seminis TaxID=722 RepID=A0A263HB93_9PAST|nr:outer membrane protein assembly factor BamC [Actinobacillus seminis]OZN24710.1 outer membrane assembly protein BamC [Actinobacillus seminis]SUU35014.1 NlpB/DapX family lipoprotein [Actinobacillus seminis]
MKKWLFTAAILTTLTACSTSNESKRVANDTFERKGAEVPTFSSLSTGGLTVYGQDNTYKLPQINSQRSQNVDIRPPENPLPIIGNSVAQFDGERALIAYPLIKESVYNLKQIERLLREQNIKFTSTEGKIVTDWTPTGREDDIGDTQVRYQIEQVSTQTAAALFITILQMKRNDIIFTPNLADKQRYASERLNQLVGELNATYIKQRRELNSTPVGTIQSALVTDMNGRTALALNSNFAQSWVRLGEVLPRVGFEIENDKPGRGYRELKYRPLDDDEWLRLSTAKPDLEKGDYSMQLTALGKQSAVVIADEDGKALSGNNAQAIYQALQNLLGK